MLITAFYLYLARGLPGATPSRVWTDNLPIQLQLFNPLGHSSLDLSKFKSRSAGTLLVLEISYIVPASIYLLPLKEQISEVGAVGLKKSDLITGFNHFIPILNLTKTLGSSRFLSQFAMSQKSSKDLSCLG